MKCSVSETIRNSVKRRLTLPANRILQIKKINRRISKFRPEPWRLIFCHGPGFLYIRDLPGDEQLWRLFAFWHHSWRHNVFS